MLKVTRTTNESNIEVRLNPSGLKSNYKETLNTPNAMLNHMLEHLAYRSGIGIEVHCEYDGFPLEHVLFEDLGLTVGRAFSELLERSVDKGCYGFGDACGIIDEAFVQAAISFESRSLFLLDDSRISMPAMAEDAKSEDLVTFLDGFCQGARCTLHILIQRGENAHHIWEAVYRALGSCLEKALTVNPARAGKTSGVAGKIRFTVEE